MPISAKKSTHSLKTTPAASSQTPKKQSNLLTPRGIQSIETGFTILDALMCAGQTLALGKIADQTGLTVANVHYYLVSFQRVGVVQQDPDTGHYGLGNYALKLGVAALEQFDLYKLARPAMLDISLRTGHTVFLGVWGNKGPTIVYRVSGNQSPPLLELRVGSVLPLLSSALGLNFAAHLPVSVTTTLFEAELALHTPAVHRQAAAVPKTMKAIQARTTQIRTQGYSRCHNTLLPNFTSLSAPIFDLSGHIIAALTVMSPNHLLAAESEAKIIALLKFHAAHISQTNAPRHCATFASD